MTSKLRQTLPGRVLCLVTDLELAGGPGPLRRIVAAAARGGVNMVQVRAHALDEKALSALSADIQSAVGSEMIVTVNGSLRAAIESGAGGVHLPWQAADAAEIAKTAHSRGLFVGRSVHSPQSAARAIVDGADYLVIGTVFASRTHPGGPVCGIDGVRLAAEASDRVPVVGIGGVTSENAGSVIDAGAAGVAVISAILGDPDPMNAARRISTAIAGA